MQARPCPTCGRPLPVRATFCEHCGTRFQPASQRPPTRPPSAFLPSRPAGQERGPARPAPAGGNPPAGASGPQRPPAPPSSASGNVEPQKGPTRLSAYRSGGPSRPEAQRDQPRYAPPNRSAYPSEAPAQRERSPNPATARTRPPTRQPGEPEFRQRPRAPSQPGGSAAAAPRKSHARLIVILAVVVGVVIGTTIGIFAFTRKGPAHTAGGPSPTSTSGNTGKIVGNVSFTASGGLQGSFTISLPDTATPASSIQKGASASVLELVVNNATMNFQLELSPYPGPGSYTLLPLQTKPAPGRFNGTVSISNQQNSWSLHPPAQCSVTIASDTTLSIQVQKMPLHEVKGGFACPALASDAGGAAPLKVSQGQFDVYVEVLGS